MITNSIERAQKKVEENNFGIRKRLLEYDDVMNSQREVIYAKRKHGLFGDRLAVDIANMFYDVCEHIVSEHQEQRDFDNFKLDLLRNFGMEPPFTEKEFFAANSDQATDKLYEMAYETYRKKAELIANESYPIIKDVFENNPKRYENIAIPITDGVKTLQAIANLKKSYDNKGKDVTLAIEKGISLAIIDDAWKDHLREMDDLKQSVQSATYEQKDPLLIYKFESFGLFKKMVQKINKDIVSFLEKGNLPFKTPDNIQEARQTKTDMSKLKVGRDEGMEQARNQRTSEVERTQPVKVEKKVNRNDLCPCGSGKRYKNCHGTGE
jgi:preprotein translocase subunit SecA